MDRDDLVELRKFSHLHEAELAVATLEASDIDAVLRDTSYGGFRPEASIAGGGVTVLVRRDERDAANEILDAPTLHDASIDAGTCANCGRSLRGAVCSACDADEREAVLDPARTRASIAKLKAVVVFVPVVMDKSIPHADDRIPGKCRILFANGC